MWTGIIGAVITFSTAIFVVLHKHDITAGLAAFVIIYSVEAINGIAWVIRITATLENSMVAVERVREFTELDSEAEWDSNDRYKPNSDWPTTGRIDFSHYTASYRPGLDPVLKDLNLTVKSGEKVGIVGRTGAGKSSMVWFNL
jgi:ABC-type multidrug transport system fused ATPase/permease subunit